MAEEDVDCKDYNKAVIILWRISFTYRNMQIS